jgi:hypothetical protein
MDSRSFDIDCTVRITNTPDELSAHVELDGDPEVGAGDHVVVHGGPLGAPFGSVRVERRRATVTRASWLRRTWVRLTGDFGCVELLETSFTDRRTL